VGARLGERVQLELARLLERRRLLRVLLRPQLLLRGVRQLLPRVRLAEVLHRLQRAR
jgi:hypothetical protein